jgi:hypothetical protein
VTLGEVNRMHKIQGEITQRQAALKKSPKFNNQAVKISKHAKQASAKVDSMFGTLGKSPVKKKKKKTR